MGKKLLIAAGAAVLLGAIVVCVIIGPRNIIGMLRYDQRAEGALRRGERAPDVALLTLDGSPAHLKDRLGTRPAVLIFGSFT